MRDDVAALYVDARGPYPSLVKEWFDEKRDARTYDGPLPVVAHPPCGPWGRLKFLNKHQDASLGPLAVEQVRRWGGVLEHPEHSSLWKHCDLPQPGHYDWAGGRTFYVEQVAWGHPCKKKTWIYTVGIMPDLVLETARKGGTVTHRITNGSRGDTSLPCVSAMVARCSPPAFAEWLLELASTARPSRGSP